MFDKIKEYYDNGGWSKIRLITLVQKGVITKEEYKKITGLEYEE